MIGWFWAKDLREHLTGLSLIITQDVVQDKTLLEDETSENIAENKSEQQNKESKRSTG